MNRRELFRLAAGAPLAAIVGSQAVAGEPKEVLLLNPRRLPRMTYQEVYDEYMRDGYKREAFIRERDSVHCPFGTKICDGPCPDIDGELWVTIHHPSLPPTPPGKVIPVVNASLRLVVTRPVWPNHKEVEAMYQALRESNAKNGVMTGNVG